MSETAHDAGRSMCGFFVRFFLKNTLTAVKKRGIMLKCIIMTLYTQNVKMSNFLLCISLKFWAKIGRLCVNLSSRFSIDEV